jgi:glucose-6-phosphate 1-dehydrogenase
MDQAVAAEALCDGWKLERLPDPCVMAIFGASGDLTRRKLMPAIYNLGLQHLLPKNFSVAGVSNIPMSDAEFRRQMKEAVHPEDNAAWEEFSRGLYYLTMDFQDPEGYKKLTALLAKVDAERGTCCRRIFYLATFPSLIKDIVGQLGAAGLAHPSGGWARIVIEKPFGRDLESARALNNEILKIFDEEQVYRIDHYLGKETVQNILVFRFSGGIFEPIWNRRYINHVQITVAESLGIERRGAYYEEAGALRDMIESHMLQLVALTAMEPPVGFGSDSVRDEKAKALRSIRPISESEVKQVAVRGQYGRGTIAGQPVAPYREEANVKADSSRETYAAVKLMIDNWRWADVPFYLRTGKRMPARVTEVAIQFRRPPLALFRNAGPMEANLLTLRIQPDESISLSFGAKLPGPVVQVRPVTMDFNYESAFGVPSPEAYELLLLDCMLGDPTLFARKDTVEVSWSLVGPILKAWDNTPRTDFPNYAAGTWGPKEGDELLSRDGRAWRKPGVMTLDGGSRKLVAGGR